MSDRRLNAIWCLVLLLSLTEAKKRAFRDDNGKSLSRLNYSPEVEAAINAQINMELWASYAYMSMSWYFNREDIALNGFHNFYAGMAFEEWEHGQWFIKYQNLRGGRFTLKDIKAPGDEWGSGLEAMKTSLDMEKKVTQALLDLHALCLKKGDAQCADWLAVTFLTEQVETVKKMSDWITILEQEGDRSFDSTLADYADKHAEH